MANQNLLAQMESIAQKILDDLDAQETWAGRVSDAIYTDLLDGKIPTLGTIASKFGLSARHLQNKLQSEGGSYQALIDNLRKELAIQYLKNLELSISEIAHLLGYSEQSAFKRWTDVTPGSFRQIL